MNDDEYLKLIGERIKHHRKLLHMSQEELAHKVGYTTENAFSSPLIEDLYNYYIRNINLWYINFFNKPDNHSLYHIAFYVLFSSSLCSSLVICGAGGFIASCAVD